MWHCGHVTSDNNEPKKDMTLNDTIKALVEQIRECRNDRSIPVLLGQGYAVSVKDYPACAARVSGGWNFSGTWNRATSYWDQSKAEAAMKAFSADRPEMKLRIAHRNTLRDECEKNATATLQRLLKLRHCDAVKAAFK